ncbi:RraA-like protein [Tilletiaria anomala UBC 951]|uniref:RraA-like protein n=1 Tax=Tilletiaria anomala (strain ATCC 24038 / CBS 436.72 / UBC 951) TaxID=1037660 RepID=A0A066VUX9_TILAU|nr:RraA-like protein [Tilletiaria anomala UBC 951]KDN44093.1 RraA-like protein [Tilletiaria anomala UBC 951]
MENLTTAGAHVITMASSHSEASGSSSPATAALAAKLGKYSTCEVSDALIKLKLPHGGHLPGIDMLSPQHLARQTRICGPAFTVKMVSQTEESAPKPAKHFVDAAEPGSVMIVTAPSNCRSAIWGGLMTARAQALGVKGVVLDGRCRDLTEHRDAGFAVFSRGHSTLGQSTFTRPSELQVPVEIMDPTCPHTNSSEPHNPVFLPLTVHPGDLILADVDGVVCVPPSLAGEVCEMAQRGREVDEKCMADLKKGRPVAETFKEHRGK